MIPLDSFPALNASLNALSAVLLVVGYSFIRRQKIAAHKATMVSAFAVSVLFLACYLYYHFHHGSTAFQGQGAIRMLYFSILISHTILAVTIVPLVLVTLARAWRGQFDRHRRIARWTFPLWLYVSITGVVVYWFLYQSPWATP